MKCRAAIAVMVAILAWPAFAQRGSGNGAGFGNRGFGGNAGSSARPDFSGHQGFIGRGTPKPGGYAHAAPFRYGSLGPPPAVRFNPPHISTSHISVSQNGIMASRPAYRAEFRGRDRIWNGQGDRGWDRRGDRNGDHDRDRDRFRGRARSFQNWYLYSYPGSVGYGYPYVLDSGFYDWSDYDNSGYDQNNETSGYNGEGPDYQPESPNGNYAEPEGYGEPGNEYGQLGEQPPPWPEPPASEPAPGSHFSVSGLSAASSPALEGPLTVIFKGGRAPEKMQNYMLTTTALTDLDADHYEQISLNQIDLAATARANRASGLEFRIPDASRD